MKNNYRMTLLATAIAALISAPAWSSSDISTSFEDSDKDLQTQAQQATYGGDAGRSSKGADRARASDNPLYKLTPDELSGMDVVGPDDKSIGKIKTVVLDGGRDDVHAVISSGGLMGFGSREVLVPIAELTRVDDGKVRANLTKESAESRPEFKADDFGVMESDRRISDFSAFEPARTSAAPAATRVGSGAAGSPRAEARANTGSSNAAQTQMSERSDMSSGSLHGRTPSDIQGMDVVGKNCQSIGKINGVVTGNGRDAVHAVVSSGGFLGLGAREILVSLDDLQIVGEDDHLQASFNQDRVEGYPEYRSDDYHQLASDRPISEFRNTEPRANR